MPSDSAEDPYTGRDDVCVEGLQLDGRLRDDAAAAVKPGAEVAGVLAAVIGHVNMARLQNPASGIILDVKTPVLEKRRKAERENK